MSDDQAAAIAFLADPATHGGTPVERIDTHGSIVFLAGDRVYKLKRQVRFSYMDYSTPPLRRAACEAELAVNRRTAPSLYLEVRAIVRRGAALAFADASAPGALDWVVVMRRFEDATQFDRLAAAGRLDPALARACAAAVAHFHRAQAPVRGMFGGAEGLARVVDENRHEIARQAAVLPEAVAAPLDAATRRAFAGVAPLLDARRAAGHVRRCHGDLHLANICLLDGAPTLFDAIEFNDDIAIIDTLFDVAFLLLDLEFRLGPAHANAAFNAYLEVLPETDGLAALPLMLSLRGGIRAHTRAAAAGRAGGPAATALADEARRYLAHAAACLEAPPPRLVAVGGVSGSGKSTLARALAPELAPSPGAAILRSDVLRKELAGVGPTERLGAEHYTAARSRAVYDLLLARAAAILAAGRSVVVDAVFQRPGEREEIAAVAARAGRRFDGIWLEPDPAEAAARIAARRDDASDATPAVLAEQVARDAGDLGAWHRIAARGEASQVATHARVAIS